MASLKDNIGVTLPKENSGPIASNRFDYQKDWAICKILDLHEKPEDYLLTLEYFDDIIVFDSSTDPTKISFYQIKTKKDAHWTIKSLISRKNGKLGPLNSHLGKMYDHIETFGEAVLSLNFVTNTKIKGILKNKVKCEDTDEFCLDDLEDNEINAIIENLKAEHSLNELKDFKKITFFELGVLDINKHSVIAKGILSEFIDRYLPNVNYKIAPLYKSIFDEIKKKSNIESAVLGFDELKDKKSISRANFDSYLSDLSSRTSLKESRASIENRLNMESIGFYEVKKFLKNSVIYEIKRMTYNDKALISVEKKVDLIINSLNLDLNNGIYSSMEIILEETLKNTTLDPNIDMELLKSIILHKLYE